MSKITNVTELRDDLLNAYDMLKSDPKRHNQVKELSNTAGKILASLKIELEYAGLRGEIPNIPFIGTGTPMALKIASTKRLEEGNRK